MARTSLSFADGFYVSESSPYLNKRAVNVRPIIPQSEAVNERAFFETPGITEFSDVVTGNSRGGIVFSDGAPYRVIGNALYSFDSAGVATNRGAITGTSDVSIASNGINIAIQDPTGDSYFYTPSTTTLQLNNDAVFLSFGQSTSVTFKDGFYIYTTDAIFFSSSDKTINDGKDFNALDVADAEISPDNIVVGHNNHNQLYIGGSGTLEVYRTLEGTSGFPFQRIPGAMIPKGVAARFSMIEFDNTFVFVGGGLNEKPAIWRALGSSVQKISTSSVDQLLQKSTETEIANIRAFSYAERGNYFAVFTVGDHTFVYDAAVSALSGKHEWHERQTGITNGEGFQPWRAIHGLKAFGEIQVGDDRSGKVGELSFNVKTEYDDPIDRFFTTLPFNADGNSIFNQEIELGMQVGVGDMTTPNPTIRMDYSDDGGNTFSNEITKSMGAAGEFKTRVRWTRLGRIPNTRMLRFKMSDPVPFNVYALYANAEVTNRG